MVLNKAQSLVKQASQLVGRRAVKPLTPQDVVAARAYIAAYWSKLERFNPKDEGSLIGLPKPYLVPSYAEGHEFDYNELYYWDSYFMVQGILDDAHKDLVMGILEDLVSLFKRFGIIPNGSQLYYLSRSHPPLLTSFIFDVYDAYHPNEKWLKEMIKVAQAEYRTVWMGTRKPNARLVYEGLNRYYDFNYLHDLTEAESGWDYTPRFNRRALDYLPIDLNAFLYKYEMDFARAALLLGNKKEAKEWESAAAKRKRAINRLMWDKIKGQYFDYNYVKERRGTIDSVATYAPMWAGMVDDKQAKALVKSLRRFEVKGGLSTTDKLPLSQYRPGAMPTQWAYPNGWAPLHFLAIKALQRYGYDADAERVATKWLCTNLNWFNRHGIFLEKYNVVDPEKPPARGVYPSQTGFGWTNAVFERLCQEFIDKRVV